MGVVENIAETCDSLGEIDLAGITLETADPALLDVTQMELGLHVSMQPAAVAYYGSLYRAAVRRLEAAKRSFSRWERKKYAEAKASLISGTDKFTVEDVKCRFIIDNESELEKWDKRLDNLQMEHDTLQVWVDAWRQKSFTIREHASITEDERYNSSSSLKSSDISRDEGMSKVKGIIRKRQGSQAN